MSKNHATSNSEMQNYETMIECLKKAGECARVLGFQRSDPRWGKISDLLQKTETTVNQVMVVRRLRPR